MIDFYNAVSYGGVAPVAMHLDVRPRSILPRRRWIDSPCNSDGCCPANGRGNRERNPRATWKLRVLVLAQRWCK